MKGPLKLIAQYFEFEQHGATFRTEIRGGCVSFLTMSYILLVNPRILTSWIQGTETPLLEIRDAYLDNIATSTAIVCCASTLLVGIVTKLPFSIGPGMSMNTFFAGAVTVAKVAKDDMAESTNSWNIAIAASFFSGVLVLLAAISSLSPKIIAALPAVLKSAIMVGIGLFQAFVGLRTIQIIQTEPTTLVKLVSFKDFDFSETGPTSSIAKLLFIVSLFLSSSLYVLNVSAAIIISITVITIVCWSFSICGVEFPTMPFMVPAVGKIFGEYDGVSPLFKDGNAIGTMLSFTLITLFDVGGVMYGILSIRRFHELENRHERTLATIDALEKGQLQNAEEEDDEVTVGRAQEEEEEQKGLLAGGNENRGPHDNKRKKEKKEKQHPSNIKKQERRQQQEGGREREAEDLSPQENPQSTTSTRHVKIRTEAVVAEEDHEHEEDYLDDDPYHDYVHDEEASHHSQHHHDMHEDISLVGAHPEILSYSQAMKTFVCVGLGTMISAVFGCSPVVIFLESAAGVAAGARTGFASIVASCLFLASMVFVPVFRNVPICACSPTLVIIGCFMMSSVADIPWNDHKYAMPAFLTIIMMPFTASITPGIVAGIFAYGYLYLVHKGYEKLKTLNLPCWRGRNNNGERYDQNNGEPLEEHVGIHQEEEGPDERGSVEPEDDDGKEKAVAAHHVHGVPPMPPPPSSGHHHRQRVGAGRPASSVSARSHTHSLGYNVDEPFDGSVGFHPISGLDRHTTDV